MKLLKFLSEEFTAGSVLYEDRENYYQQFVESTDYTYYIDLLKPSDIVANDFATKQDIKMFGIDFGSDLNTIIKALERPRMSASYQHHGYHVDVYFFKRHFYEYSAIVQTHLVNNQFVFGSITVPQHNGVIAKIFSKLVTAKYGNDMSEENLINCTTNDIQGNRISFRNFFYPSLLYISHDIKNVLPEIFSAKEQVTVKPEILSSEWLKWV